MADGDFIYSLADVWRIRLIDAATAADNGVWVDSRIFNNASIHLVPGTGTLQIRGSDEPTKPANTAHGYQLGTDATTEARLEIRSLPQWIKGRVSSHSSGTHNIYATLRKA